MKRAYDYVFVGSGIAATLVASSLLESNPCVSILLLEAGPEIPLRNRRSWWDLVLARRTPYDWTYDRETGEDPESKSVGSTQWGFKESRVRAVGGSTMHWGGWSLRYKEEDFNCRQRTGQGADWPLTYAELEPWYAAAEEVLSVGGDHTELGPWRSGAYPLPAFSWSAHESLLAQAMEKEGLVPGHMPIARFSRCMTTGTCKYCPIGSRFTAQDLLASLVANPRYSGLEVRTSCPVIEVLADAKRAQGVKVLDLGTGQSTDIAAGHVVISAGTYESAKLLLRSRSEDWPNGLGNQYDQVGRNLVTHTMLRVVGHASENRERWNQEYDFPTLVSRSWDTPERQREGKVLLFSDRTLPRVDIAAEMIAGKTRAQVDAVVSGPRRGSLHAFIEEFGHPENRLTLGPGDGIGEFGLPKMLVYFQRASNFDEVTNRVVGDMSKILVAAGYGKIESRVENPRGDHASGTCRMGVDPVHSVVDAHLRVHGIDNLYVCSNATLPTAAAVNPTLTLASLALRLGAHLSDKRAVPV